MQRQNLVVNRQSWWRDVESLESGVLLAGNDGNQLIWAIRRRASEDRIRGCSWGGCPIQLEHAIFNLGAECRRLAELLNWQGRGDPCMSCARDLSTWIWCRAHTSDARQVG